MADLFSGNVFDQQSKDAEDKKNKAFKKVKNIQKMQDTKRFSSMAMQALVGSKNNIVGYYQSNKAAIERGLKITIPFYSTILSATYTICSLPRTAIQGMLGNSLRAQGIMLMYDLFIGRYFAVNTLFVSIFDYRTYTAIWKTFMSIIGECLPLAAKTLIFGIFECIRDLFNIVLKALGLKKNIESIEGRQMLTEAKRKSLLRRMFDWVKSSCAKVLEKFGSTLWYVFKKGYRVFEYFFLKFINPIAQCVQKNNRMSIGASFGGAQSVGATTTTAVQYICSTLGFTSAVAGAAMGFAGLASGMWLIVGTAATSFAIFGYLATIGNIMEIVEMTRDIMDWN